MLFCLFYNNVILYIILFFMCIIFHSKKKSLKNVTLCVFESVRPFKKHREVLTNPIVLFTENH